MWKMKSGETVVDRQPSHLHEDAGRWLPQALARIESKGRDFINEEIGFGRVIGETVCVRTHPADQIIFAQRVNRLGLTRFVKNRQAEPCRSLVVILKRAAEDRSRFILMTAYVGHRAEPEPWDKSATERSVAFWDSHALIWGSEPIVPGTVTAVCPW